MLTLTLVECKDLSIVIKRKNKNNEIKTREKSMTKLLQLRNPVIMTKKLHKLPTYQRPNTALHLSHNYFVLILNSPWASYCPSVRPTLLPPLPWGFSNGFSYLFFFYCNREIISFLRLCKHVQARQRIAKQRMFHFLFHYLYSLSFHTSVSGRGA